MADAAVLRRLKDPPPFGRNEPARSSNVVGHDIDKWWSASTCFFDNRSAGGCWDAGRARTGYCSYRAPETSICDRTRSNGARLLISKREVRKECEKMSDLVFIAFDSEQRAEAVREKVLGMQKEYLIELGDAVVAVKDADGRIKLNQLMNTTAQGAMTGALWGALIGLIFLNPLIGMGIGAASGALSGKLVDVGINDQFMTDAASALRPGTAGLFLLIRKMTTDKVLKDLAGIGGTVMRTSFDETKEAALREALAGRAAAEATTAPPA